MHLAQELEIKQTIFLFSFSLLINFCIAIGFKLKRLITFTYGIS